MATFILGFIIIVISIAGLAVGVLFGRPALRGSCGGLSCGTSPACTACTARKKEPNP